MEERKATYRFDYAVLLLRGFGSGASFRGLRGGFVLSCRVRAVAGGVAIAVAVGSAVGAWAGFVGETLAAAVNVGVRRAVLFVDFRSAAGRR